MTDPVWPVPQLYFSVTIGGLGADLSFQEVTGLDMETEIIADRAGDSTAFSTGNVTLKRGVCADAKAFWDWYNQVKLDTIKRVAVSIKLMDEMGKPTITWRLANAFPTKIDPSGSETRGNEIAIELLEFAHEGLTLENA